jgi:hypothetical protein
MPKTLALPTFAGPLTGPTTPVPAGTVVTIDPQISNPPQPVTGKVSLEDGTAQSCTWTVVRALTFSVNPADKGKTGYVVGEVDIGVAAWVAGKLTAIAT